MLSRERLFRGRHIPGRVELALAPGFLLLALVGSSGWVRMLSNVIGLQRGCPLGVELVSRHTILYI